MDFLNENPPQQNKKLPMLNGANMKSGQRIRNFFGSSRRAALGLLLLLISNVLFLLLAIVFAVLYINGSGEQKPVSPTHPMPKWPAPSESLLGEYAQAAVAADNEICSDIGRDTLLKGGNAVEAAIATLFCIGVMDTYSAGLGGGHLMTIYNATTQKCHVVDAREFAPKNSSEDMYFQRWDKSQRGWEAVAVPGELHGFWTEYTNFGGNLPWHTLVEPTVSVVEEGYPISHSVARALKAHEEEILANPVFRKKFTNPETGKLFGPGEQIKTRSDLTEMMRKIAKAEDPVQLFYNSDLTKTMVEEFQTNGGRLSLEDFTSYKALLRPDSEVLYTHLSKGRTICGPPPPSGSVVAQGIINILDPIAFNLTTFSGTVDFLHRFIEASKFAYSVRNSLGDIAYVPTAMELAKKLTSKEWAESVRAKMTWGAQPDAYYDEPNATPKSLPPDHGTAHMSIIDRWGNAVAATTTLNLAFGAMVLSEATGIIWNDQMDDFSSPGAPNYWGYEPSPENFIQPGKRPMSSMTPIIIFNRENGKEILSIGGAGGSTITSGVAGDAFHSQWLGMNIKESIDFPRLHNQLRPNVTVTERSLPEAYRRALEERGHRIEEIGTVTIVTGVHRTQEGTIQANSDWRKGWESMPSGY